MAHLDIADLRKSYGSTPVIRRCDLSIDEGEFVVLVGPSGCGKSTLLRCIAGLEPIDHGTLHIDGRDMTQAAPAQRGVAMVFQSYALYPHMTVAQNIGFGLKIAGEPAGAIAQRVRDIASLLKLDQLLERKPKALSGGQRQRVAIGRALARKPRIFLFDEPLSNLDAALRAEMRVELARLHAELGATMVYVTHDQVEAMTLARRIVIMQGGVIEQIGTPLELYNRPVNRFVAAFLGQPPMNFLPLRRGAANGSASHVVLADEQRVRVGTQSQGALAVAVELGIRAEDLETCGQDDGGFRVTVEVVEQLGSETLVYASTDTGTRVIAKLSGQVSHAPASHLWLRARPERAVLFDEHGRNLACLPPG